MSEDNKKTEEEPKEKFYKVKPTAEDFVSVSVANESTNVSFKGTSEKVVSEKEAKVLKTTGLFEVSETTAKPVAKKETPKQTVAEVKPPVPTVPKPSENT